MSKNKSNQFIDTVDECLTNGVNHGLFHVNLEDKFFEGNNVRIDGENLVNFTSCSYLGLQHDIRLKQGVINAVNNYGTQYSSSRAYSKCPLYEELEALFYQIFKHQAILAPTTTLTHIAAIPILIGDNDLIINDHQVHASVQIGTQLVMARGTKVELLRHNDLNKLEEILKANHAKYNKVWYMVDGLYSMYGDFAPLKEIQLLLNKYPNFNLYIDDAHGMSWAGKNGSGYALTQIELSDQIVLTNSVSKGFAGAGGLLVMTNKELLRKILTCGTSYTTGGPIQPPLLGACIESAKIHLSAEIYLYQDQLKTLMERFIVKCDEYCLPLMSRALSPIMYIGLGLPRVGYNMVKRLMKEGFFTNVGIFPGVPVRCAGIRITINRLQSVADIDKLVAAIAKNFPLVLEEENQTVQDLERNFKTDFSSVANKYQLKKKEGINSKFHIKHTNSINDIDKQIWNDLLGDNGSFDWDGCLFLEETFRDNPEPENNWKFHYVIISDSITGKPILATFFTELLCKDDMIASASVSEKIEKIRQNDKYYLTSKVIMMGSLLTEGNHLYLNRSHVHWQEAMLELIKIMNDAKQQSEASIIQLRDLDSNDFEMREFLIKEGFIRVEMPDAHVIENNFWENETDYLTKLSYKSRIHLRKYILNNQALFNVRICSDLTTEKTEKIIALYKNVKARAYSINTFTLPNKFFYNINRKPWEIIEISLQTDPLNEPIAFGICYVSCTKNYIPLVLGLDYQSNHLYYTYRQILFQAVKRASKINANKIYFGYGADTEKHKFASVTRKKSVYIQSNDTFNLELLNMIKK